MLVIKYYTNVMTGTHILFKKLKIKAYIYIKSYLPTLDVLNCYQTPAPGHGASRFLSKTLIMRSKYYLIGFSFANALNIYSFQKYNKTEKKVNTPYPSPLSSMAVVTSVSPL